MKNILYEDYLGPRLPRQMQLKRLRRLGAGATLLALGCCLGSDHATMAVLVWAMLLAASSVATALVLATRPRALRALAPWVRGTARGRGATCASPGTPSRSHRR